MKLLRNLVIALIAILVVVVGVAYLLPATFSVQGSAVIPSPPDSLYAKFATPKSWARWSAWTTQQDPALAYTYAGPDSGVGAIMRWTSRKMGAGQLEIAEAVPAHLVRYDLSMAGSDMAVHGRVTFEPAEGGTKVTWADTGTLGRNPLMRYFHPMLNKAMGAAYQTSFDNLKREAQGG